MDSVNDEQQVSSLEQLDEVQVVDLSKMPEELGFHTGPLHFEFIREIPTRGKTVNAIIRDANDERYTMTFEGGTEQQIKGAESGQVVTISGARLVKWAKETQPRVAINRATTVTVKGQAKKKPEIMNVASTDFSKLIGNEKGPIVARYVHDFGQRPYKTSGGSSFSSRGTKWEDVYGQTMLITFAGAALDAPDGLEIGKDYRLHGLRLQETKGSISARASSPVFEAEPVVME